MKKISTLIFIVLAFNAYAQKQFAEQITAAQLKTYMQVLCSDTLEGRETGTIGMMRTVNYLASVYKNLGIRPYEGNSYFQNYELNLKTNTNESELSVGNKKHEVFKDFYFFSGFDDLTLTSTPTEFVGFGINDKNTNYNNYENLNVKDKIVLAFDGEPMGKDSIYQLTGTKESSLWSQSMRQKYKAAKEAGAKMLLIISPDFDKNIKDERLMHFLQKPTTTLKVGKTDGRFPTLIINEKVAINILGKKQYNAYKTCYVLNGKCKPMNKKVSKPIAVKIKRNEQSIDAKNVLAYIPGTTNADEVVVMSAHLDHLGIQEGKIYYGADDDASGTSAVLNLAKAFTEAAKQGYRCKRSLLFLNFSGEEKGLLGSSYYSQNPIFNLKNTVVDLNIDMIGRRDKKYENDPNYVYVIGSEMLSTELKEISEKQNITNTNLKLDYTYDDENDPNQFYYRSDHYNFAKYDIPVIFYFNGVHEDYHKPTDTIDKIEFEKMEKITRLVFHTAWEIANRNERLTVDKKSDRK